MNTPVEDQLLFDVGAHNGEDSDFYLKLGYRVVAVEPNPILVERLRQRFRREIDEGRYTLIDRAIGPGDGTVRFFVNKERSHWGTTDPSWAQRNSRMGADSEEITVQAIRFLDIIRAHGCPKYLKIDIEGADMLCVEELAFVAHRPTYLSIESSKTSWRALLREFSILEALGYTKFKVVDQRNHRNGMYRTRLGEPIMHVFEWGSSGPFGEHLGGAWVTKRRAILKYAKIFLLYKTIGDNTPLRRLIRRVPFVRRILRRVSWYDTHAARG